MSRESGARWDKAHPERAREYRRRWRRSNTELTNAATKRHMDKRRALLDSHKAKPCADCGIQYPPYVMDFDHLDATQKSLVLSSGYRRNLEVVLAEIEKCDVVCSNCHRIRTHERTFGDGKR